MKLLPITLVLLLIISALPLAQSQAMDSEKPEIISITAGLPSSNETFKLTATITDDVEVVVVRFYVYFRIGQGISTPEYPEVLNPTPSTYESAVDVPINATLMYYTISANDTSDNWNITDVFNKEVEDIISPTAMHSNNATVNLGQSYHFNASLSSDNVGIENYSWTFNYDGMVRSLYGVEPEFNFTLSGPYIITLAVTDAWGNSDTDIFTLQTKDSIAPVADAGIDLFVIVGEPATLDASDSWDNVRISSYTWTLQNNGTLVTLTGQSCNFTYWETGNYFVSLEVEDAAGNKDNTDITIHVLRDSESTGTVSWWLLALLAIVFIAMVLGIIIIRK